MEKIAKFHTLETLVLLCMLIICPQAWSLEDEQLSSVSGLAGKYYFGDHLGSNERLIIQEDGYYSYKGSRCLGTYAKSAGKASLVNGVLTLKPETASGTQPSDLIPLKWGDRLYLIDKDEILDFCNEINQAFEPRKYDEGFTYIREPDWRKAVTGAPNLPEEWRSFVLKKPLKGKIVCLLDPYVAEIDLGAEDGVRCGMLLTAHGKGDFTQLCVAIVRRNQCVAVYKYIDSSRSDCCLAKDQIVTSRFHDWDKGPQ